MKFLEYFTTETSDQDLMRLVSLSDERAYNHLVEKHMTPIFRLSYSLLKDRAKAEDVTQDTFLKLWQSAEKWDPKAGKLRSWLFRIAHNKCIDELRRIKPHSDIDNTVIKDEKESGFDKAYTKEITNIINEKLKELPARQQEAIMLVYFLECSHKEAAMTMDISVDAFESLIIRGRKKLKALMIRDKEMLLNGEVS